VIKQHGAEILRLWAAMVDYRDEVRLGKEILARVVEAYRKLRNTLRYLLMNLYDFDPATDLLPVEKLRAVDRYILARYAAEGQRIVAAYEAYDYPTIVQTVNAFAIVDLSAFYNDISKDRLYTFGASSAARRSAQTTMYVMLEGLVRLLAPILPVTSDELWRTLPGRREDSVHLTDFPTDLDRWRNEALIDEWTKLIAVRDSVNLALEAERQRKVIGAPLEARVTLEADGELYDLLHAHEADLPMLFITSQVTLRRRAAGAAASSSEDQGRTARVIVERADGTKCQRCWRYVTDISREPAFEGICQRCVDALASFVG
jgi:isoleucyl-tRNA synthetase